jgi:hypothetical protein
MAGTNTACHSVVNILTVMCSKIVPNENPVEVSAWDIVCLNIPANIITKIAKNIAGGTNCAYTFDPASRTFNTLLSMWWQVRISWLDIKDDSHLHAMMIMPIHSDVHHLHSPPPAEHSLTH